MTLTKADFMKQVANATARGEGKREPFRVAAPDDLKQRILGAIDDYAARQSPEGPVSDSQSIPEYGRGYNAALDAAARHIVKIRFERGTFPDRSQWTRAEAWAAIALALESAAADLETLKFNQS